MDIKLSITGYVMGSSRSRMFHQLIISYVHPVKRVAEAVGRIYTSFVEEAEKKVLGRGVGGLKDKLRVLKEGSGFM